MSRPRSATAPRPTTVPATEARSTASSIPSAPEKRPEHRGHLRRPHPRGPRSRACAPTPWPRRRSAKPAARGRGRRHRRAGREARRRPAAMPGSVITWRAGSGGRGRWPRTRRAVTRAMATCPRPRAAQRGERQPQEAVRRLDRGVAPGDRGPARTAPAAQQSQQPAALSRARIRLQQAGQREGGETTDWRGVRRWRSCPPPARAGGRWSRRRASAAGATGRSGMPRASWGPAGRESRHAGLLRSARARPRPGRGWPWRPPSGGSCVDRRPLRAR